MSWRDFWFGRQGGRFHFFLTNASWAIQLGNFDNFFGVTVKILKPNFWKIRGSEYIYGTEGNVWSASRILATKITGKLTGSFYWYCRWDCTGTFFKIIARDSRTSPCSWVWTPFETLGQSEWNSEILSRVREFLISRSIVQNLRILDSIKKKKLLFHFVIQNIVSTRCHL